MNERERKSAQLNATINYGKLCVFSKLSGFFNAGTGTMSMAQALMDASIEMVEKDLIGANWLAKLLRETADYIDLHWGE